MQRAEVIQEFINKRKFTSYLEIGVNYGSVFLNIKVKRKLGVDPFFRKKFWPKYLLHKLLNIGTSSMSCFPLTSDAFFEKKAKNVLKDGIDIVFVDGMHEAGYAFRDVENALKYLNKGGIVIMHDCNPQSQQATVSFKKWVESDRTFTWNGDVWKALILLRSSRPDLDIFVANTDFGLGIVTHGNQQQLPFTDEQVSNLQYADLEKSREYLINLKSVNFLKDYINSIQ